MNEMGGACGMRAEQKRIRNFDGETEWKKWLREHVHLWQNNIKMDLKQIVWEGGGLD